MLWFSLGEVNGVVYNGLRDLFKFDIRLKPEIPGWMNGRYNLDYTTQITTPLLYPDGDYVQVYIVCLDKSSQRGSYVVTDLGETMGWLYMNGFHNRDATDLDPYVRDVCLTFGVQFESMEFRVPLDTRERASESAVLLAQAMAMVTAAHNAASMQNTVSTQVDNTTMSQDAANN